MFPLHLDAIQDPIAPAVISQPVQLLRIHKNFVIDVESKQLFDRRVAEHIDERRIHVQKSARYRAAANAKRRAQNDRARACFGTAQRLFITLVLDGRGELL